MAEFLLLHGAAHGAWCWHRVLPALSDLGHRARAIDLPGHGDDPTPPGNPTLDDWAQAILAALDGPTILVAHSMAGFPATAAAQIDPARIAALVYLCAYVPQPGLTLAQMRRSTPDQPLRHTFQLSPDRRSFAFDPSIVQDRFYHDCPAADVALARARLCPVAVQPNETALPRTDRAMALPRFYIRCTADRAIPPALQTAMAADFPPGHVSDLPTSHSPFFAAPAALAQRLHAIATHGLSAPPVPR